jgi:hypothetical protein
MEKDDHEAAAHNPKRRVYFRTAVLLLLFSVMAVFTLNFSEKQDGSHGADRPDTASLYSKSLFQTIKTGSLLQENPADDDKWQLGPQALPEDVLAPYEAAAYSVLDTLGIPRNLSDSDLGEACGPLTWSCIATAGKCALDRITPVIDGHLSPAPSACLCFPSGMTPADIKVDGEGMALGCSFVCMESLLNAVNEYLRARNGRKGQQLDCEKASSLPS